MTEQILTKDMISEMADMLQRQGHDEAASALLLAYEYDTNKTFRTWLEEDTWAKEQEAA